NRDVTFFDPNWRGDELRCPRLHSGAPVMPIAFNEFVGLGLAGRFRDQREGTPEISHRRLAALAVPSELSLVAGLLADAPSKEAIEPLGSHPFAATIDDLDRPRIDVDLDAQAAALEVLVDGVVDQLENGLRAARVIAKETLQ